MLPHQAMKTVCAHGDGKMKAYIYFKMWSPNVEKIIPFEALMWTKKIVKFYTIRSILTSIQYSVLDINSKAGFPSLEG